jgi:hypothetical protein
MGLRADSGLSQAEPLQVCYRLQSTLAQMTTDSGYLVMCFAVLGPFGDRSSLLEPLSMCWQTIRWDKIQNGSSLE